MGKNAALLKEAKATVTEAMAVAQEDDGSPFIRGDGVRMGRIFSRLPADETEVLSIIEKALLETP